MTYQHLLLATDLTKHNVASATQARYIADKYQATLDIVHVVESSPIAYGGEFSIPVDLNLEQAIEAHARHAMADLGAKFNVPNERQHLLTGHVKQVVLELIKELKIDLVIVGTHGHHGLDHLLGSRANAILHGANCDVLAIRAKK